MNDERAALAEHFRGRAVLVTGGDGFVGGRLSEALESLGARVRFLRRSSPPGARGETIVGDLRDEGVFEPALRGVETVFHLAAQTSARASEEDPRTDYLVNAEATWRMFEACRKLGSSPTVVFAGSETEVGDPAALPLDGTERESPASFYDLHKLMAEQTLEFFARRGFVRGATLRLPSIYGIGNRERSADCGVLNRMIRTALAGSALTVYDAGDRLRDYLHVGDVVRAFLLAAAGIERCDGQHFVIGSGERTTVRQAAELVVRTVEEETGTRVPITHVAPPPDEPRIAKASFAVDFSRFHAATGWAPATTLQQGVRATIAALRGRPGDVTRTA